MNRVRKLEAGLTPVRMFTPEFLEQMRLDAEAGKLDRTDIIGTPERPGILAALQRWQRGDFSHPGDAS